MAGAGAMAVVHLVFNTKSPEEVLTNDSKVF